MQPNDESLAASRQRVSGSVSDEQLQVIYDNAWEKCYPKGSRRQAELAGIAAVRAALADVQVPEGWHLSIIEIHPLREGGGYRCALYDGDLNYVDGTASTWQAALAAACHQAQEDGK